MSSDVCTLLQMLGLQRWASVLSDMSTVDDLQSSDLWVSRIGKQKDRDILKGYLSVRKNFKAEAITAEQRMHAFSVARSALDELSLLQEKKRALAKSHNNESDQRAIELLVDQIDEARLKILAAQKEVDFAMHPVRPVGKNNKNVTSKLRSPRLPTEKRATNVVECAEASCTLGFSKRTETQFKQRMVTEREGVGPGWNRNEPHCLSKRLAKSRTIRSRAIRLETPPIFVEGQKANSISLGVRMETNHSAQMQCGAVTSLF